MESPRNGGDYGSAGLHPASWAECNPALPDKASDSLYQESARVAETYTLNASGLKSSGHWSMK